VLASTIGWVLGRRRPSPVVDNLNARINAWWVMVGVLSLSVMFAVPVTPPTERVNASAGSLTVSLTVGTVTVKLVTPAGTLILPPARSFMMVMIMY